MAQLMLAVSPAVSVEVSNMRMTVGFTTGSVLVKYSYVLGKIPNE